MINKVNRQTVTTENVFYFFLLLLAFVLPIHKAIVPFIIICLVISLIINSISKRKKLRFDFNLPELFSMILYLLLIISLTYTNNISDGLFDLEVKLSFLIFPLIAVNGIVKNENIKIEKVLSFFVLGTIISTVICFIVAIYRSVSTFYTFDYFTYTYFAHIHHPTYLAMYINFSIVILVYRVIGNWNTLSSKLRISYSLLILYLIVCILLLNSKAGIIIMFFSIIAVGFLLKLRSSSILIKIYLLVAILISGMIIVRFVPFIKNRFDGMTSSIHNIKLIKPITENDSEQRILIWKYSTEIIADNWISGVGIGDVRSTLYDKYLQEGFIAGINKNLNCHNQFLQTFMSIGIAGFICLCLIMLSAIIIAIKHEDIILLMFLVIIIGNMLTESILETQAGTTFFMFILIMLVRRSKTSNIQSERILF